MLYTSECAYRNEISAHRNSEIFYQYLVEQNRFGKTPGTLEYKYYQHNTQR